MTEIEERSLTRLPESVRRFVAHWGSMGDHWGMNRSVSQVHALLYLSEKPLTAEDIATALGIVETPENVDRLKCIDNALVVFGGFLKYYISEAQEVHAFAAVPVK